MLNKTASHFFFFFFTLHYGDDGGRGGEEGAGRENVALTLFMPRNM